MTVDDIDAAIELMFTRQSRGECMHCGSKLADIVQVGRCAYAEPCGHRQGQGSAKAMKKAAGLK